MISHEHKCIFVHIPKTAGTSVEFALTGKDWHKPPYHGQKHMAATHMRKKLYKEYWADYFKFSIIRNPWDLVHSFYNHNRHTGHEYCKDSFDIFIHNKRLPKSQSHMLCDKENNLLMDSILRFEEFPFSFQFLCKTQWPELNLKKIPHVMRAKNKHREPYWRHYSRATRDIIQEEYADDIELGSYRFGD